MPFRSAGVIPLVVLAGAATLVGAAGPAGAAAPCPSGVVCVYSEPNFGGAVDTVTRAELAEVAHTTVPCVHTSQARSAINNTDQGVVFFNIPCGDFWAPDPVAGARPGGSVTDFGVDVSFVGPIG